MSNKRYNKGDRSRTSNGPPIPRPNPTPEMAMDYMTGVPEEDEMVIKRMKKSIKKSIKQ